MSPHYYFINQYSYVVKHVFKKKRKKKGKRFVIRCWQIHRQYPLLAAFYTGRFPQDDAKLL